MLQLNVSANVKSSSCGSVVLTRAVLHLVALHVMLLSRCQKASKCQQAKWAVYAQVHNQLTEWSQDLHQLKSIMDTLEEEDQVISQSQRSGHSQPSSGDASETKGDAGGTKTLRELTTQVKEKTDTALSAANQSPQDGMALLEGIAELSKQMVGEAQEDAELFNRAGKGG